MKKKYNKIYSLIYIRNLSLCTTLTTPLTWGNVLMWRKKGINYNRYAMDGGYITKTGILQPPTDRLRSFPRWLRWSIFRRRIRNGHWENSKNKRTKNSGEWSEGFDDIIAGLQTKRERENKRERESIRLYNCASGVCYCTEWWF